MRLEPQSNTSSSHSPVVVTALAGGGVGPGGTGASALCGLGGVLGKTQLVSQSTRHFSFNLLPLCWDRE